MFRVVVQFVAQLFHRVRAKVVYYHVLAGFYLVGQTALVVAAVAFVAVLKPDGLALLVAGRDAFAVVVAVAFVRPGVLRNAVLNKASVPPYQLAYGFVPLVRGLRHRSVTVGLRKRNKPIPPISVSV